MADPEPMDPERLARLRAVVDGTASGAARIDDLMVDDLLADRDYAAAANAANGRRILDVLESVKAQRDEARRMVCEDREGADRCAADVARELGWPYLYGE